VLPPVFEICLLCRLSAGIHFIAVGSGLFFTAASGKKPLPVLSALPSEEEDLRGLDRSGNVALVVKGRFAGDASD